VVEKKNVSFLQRWSNKKILDQKSDESVLISRNEEVNFDPEEKNKRNHDKNNDAQIVSEKFEQDSVESLEGLSDAEVLEKLKLPDPETMKAGDNFKAFLAKTVPEHIRKRALRKLWVSNPILANLDGMNEYDDDFTLATSALEKFATNYVVGKGFRGQFKAEDTIDGVDLTNDNLKSSSIRISDKDDDKTDDPRLQQDSNEEQANENKSDDSEDKPFELRQEGAEVANSSGQLIDDNGESDISNEEENQTPTLRIKARKMVFKE
jgi:hypothetical protein